MNLFIPELGTKLKLTKLWEFTLYSERRNKDFLIKSMIEADEIHRKKLLIDMYKMEERIEQELKSLNEGHSPNYPRANAPSFNEYIKARDAYYRRNHLGFGAFFVAGTILEVDRIYIRKGAADFSSVTFKIRGDKVVRFWAKLNDVNKICCSVV